ncbi:hypothetical protein J3F83DRAFT_645981 [Trichoderma novae-zelandiae]
MGLFSRPKSTVSSTDIDGGNDGNSNEKPTSKSGAASNSPLPVDAEAPPPAYSPGPPGATETSPLTLSDVKRDDDDYYFLSHFDTIFLIDDSSSMSGSRWHDVQKVLHAITPICTKHDEDGIDVYFLNHRSEEEPGKKDKHKAKGGYYNINSIERIRDIFEPTGRQENYDKRPQPKGCTPTGIRLDDILKPYVKSLKEAQRAERGPSLLKAMGLKKASNNIKPVNIIVITDGRATVEPKDIIVRHARALDALNAASYQVGIQFFQVGNDREAAEWLRELDDDLAELDVRDMVDTMSWDATAADSTKALSADGILKAVLGGVVRRIDDKRPSNLRDQGMPRK